MSEHDDLLARLDARADWYAPNLGNSANPTQEKLLRGAAAAIRSLQGQLEAERRLAEVGQGARRYRHMRSSAQFQDRNGPGIYWYLPRWDRERPLGERLDASIAAAIKESAEQEKGK